MDAKSAKLTFKKSRKQWMLSLQSSLRKKSRKAIDAKSAKRSRYLCHQNLWRFASDILDKNKEGRGDSVFTQEEASDYFNSL